MQLQPVSQHNFKLFCPNVATPVGNLFAIGVYVLGLGAIGVSVSTENLWHVMPWIFLISSCVWVWVIVPLGNVCVAEIDLDLRAYAR